MKLLTVTIPSYNAEDYMENAVKSLLGSRDDVEIIIVDDGSTDRTGAIGDALEEKYPDVIRCIHQENGGHGEAVNAGLRNATGLYFKVVDSDDWVDLDAYKEILGELEKIVRDALAVDLVISNYVYEKQGAKRKKVINYRHAFPQKEVFTWEKVKRLKRSQNILMHSVIYRTQLLKDCGLELPKHTFYVDNIFVFNPLPYVKKLYYVDVNFYRYFIGREDQSVNEKVMIGRIDQQIKVNKIMVDSFNYRKISNYKLRKYMMNYLQLITIISSVLLIKSGTKENLLKKDELWNYIKETDRGLYNQLRRGITGRTINMRGKGGRKVAVIGYKIAQKIFGFN